MSTKQRVNPLDVACPNCKVPAGRDCEAKSSRVVRAEPHVWRVNAALRAR